MARQSKWRCLQREALLAKARDQGHDKEDFNAIMDKAKYDEVQYQGQGNGYD